MRQMNVHNPHDTCFKYSRSEVTVAKDLLRAYLRTDILQCIQWDALRLSNKSYTDEKLAQLHGDLVYTCKLEPHDADLYILVEQQTTPGRLLLLRFLQYNIILTE